MKKPMIEPTKIGRHLLYNADCLYVMKAISDYSVDLIFTDPPYALGSEVIIRPDGKPDYSKAADFMTKWNQPDGAFWESWFTEANRILKFGGKVLMFGIDRQLMLYKYYACFAGFKELQSKYWFFISNFPKASDLSKNLDKHFKCEREVLKPAKYAYANGDNINFDKRSSKDREILSSAKHPLAKKYEGFKYSISPLKQTNETVMVFQKKFKTGSCLHDILAMEAGDAQITCSALDIENNRVPIENGNVQVRLGKPHHKKKFDSDVYHKANTENLEYWDNSSGRYPSQTFCDVEAAKVLDKMSGESKSSGGDGSRFTNNTNVVFQNKPRYTKDGENGLGLGDSGGCSKILHKIDYEEEQIYFYCPKVSKSERNEGCQKLVSKNTRNLSGGAILNPSGLDKLDVSHNNFHPTLKPLKLLKQILALYKSPNEMVVLDTFAGSGSIGAACESLGMNSINIELSTEYIPIINARLNHSIWKTKSKNLSLF